MHRLLVLAMLAALATSPAAAHHGWGSYDAASPLTLNGTIERVQPSGPHTTIWLKSGAKTWEIVLAPPSRMANRGLPADNLRAGQDVRVYGYPSRAHDDELRAEWIATAATPDPVQLR
ncbi:MAG: DUF6152 family protein [Acetobacteraceae bacterium]